MPYATSVDMTNRYSEPTLKQLVTDDGVVPVDLATDLKMISALASAAGEVNANVLRGRRYTQADLEALTGDNAAYLADITSRLAYWRLWKRKTWADSYSTQVDDARKDARDVIDMLRTGVEIFVNDAAVEAGLPAATAISSICTEPNQCSWVGYVQRRGQFYPQRIGPNCSQPEDNFD